MKQKGLAPILLLIGILVLVGVAGGAYFLGMSRDSSPVAQPVPQTVQNITPTPEPVEVAIEEPEEISNWKTYANKELGFSINYPNTWLLYDNSIPPCKGAIAGYVFINKNPLKDCFFGDRLPADFYVVVGDIWNPLPELLPKESNSPFELSGKNGVLNYSTENSEGPRRIDTRIFVNHNNRGYDISYPNTDYKGTHEPIYDQILATFKFIP